MMMKTTAAASEMPLLLWLLFCFCIICPTASQGACESYVRTGADFTVPLTHQLKNRDRLRWERDDTVIMERKPGVDGADNYLKGSKNDIHLNGSLKLTNVTKTNEGRYTPVVHSDVGKFIENLKSLYLCVEDPVPQPELTTTCQETQVILTCSVAQVKNVNFLWFKSNNKLKDKKNTLTLDVSSIGKDSYSCRVFNHVSSRDSEVVTASCFNFFSSWFLWIAVGSGGGLVLALIIAVIICCIRAKRKRHKQIKDEEELRLGWSNQQQQEQRQQQQQQQQHCPQHGHISGQHQHQHQRQTPAGHTGPRPHRSKQHRERQSRPREPAPVSDHLQPTPRKAAQTTRQAGNGEEQPPPLPQPRKKSPRAQ